MLKIAIAEDEKECSDLLLDYIRRFEREHSVKIQADVYFDGEGLLEEFKGQYDAVFLDIQMKEINGMETARKIRMADDVTELIFVTNLAQYAISGYSVHAMNFLLKPVSYYAFSENLKLLLKKAEQKKSHYLQVKTSDGLSRIRIEEISYIETMGHHVLIHTGEREYRCRENMRTMEAQLQEHGFFRCHNVYLVNLAHVAQVGPNSVTVQGSELLVSRYKRKALLDALTRYVGNCI